MTKRRLRALYLCYLSLEDPLTDTQVVAYLSGLAAEGHDIHLLTFETGALDRKRRRERRAAMVARGIKWHGLRYHKRPSLPATVYDVFAGSAYAAVLTLRHRLDVLHARSHVPAAMVLITRGIVRRRAPALIFDIRGLMAEEYVDAGRWVQDGTPFRLTKAVERRAIGAARGIVVLTDRVRRQLFGEGGDPRVAVIPCCADLERLAAAGGADARERLRRELGFEDATVMVYVGKFGGWYMAEEMAAFFAVARRTIPDLHFLILTQGEREPIVAELERRGVAAHATITSAPPEAVGSYLAAADFGVSFIRPSPSKASSSPTKVGEYLGAGLPVLSTAGVGDLDALLTPSVGVLVDTHSDAAYAAAATRIAALAGAPETAVACRALAVSELSLTGVGIPRYAELYEHIS